MDFFTQQHFDLLNEWSEKKYDNQNVEHKAAYKELADVYKLVHQWADQIKKEVFPQGRVSIIKKPTNQGQIFESYLWAKIYPQKDSPKELAYTIGFNTEGLDIKIDTVGLDESKDKRRKNYLEARGDFDSSGIVSLMPIEDAIKLNLEQVLTWSKQQMESFDMGYDEVANKMGLYDDESTTSGEPIANGRELNSVTPLNQILYGPPGTGKTYHTVQASVKAAEPEFTAKSRADLKKKYDQLVAEKRIQFVTFHQSYGYEEFVEGLRASSDQGQVSYDVEPGIFKQICEQASQGVEPNSDPLEQALEQFKVELEEVSVIKLKTVRGKEFDVQYHGNNTFRVFPGATTVDDLGRGYAVSIDNIKKLY
jgi:5-methylcytosine-specific restriction protein B